MVPGTEYILCTVLYCTVPYCTFRNVFDCRVSVYRKIESLKLCECAKQFIIIFVTVHVYCNCTVQIYKTEDTVHAYAMPT
jgi:hypothetical protein